MVFVGDLPSSRHDVRAVRPAVVMVDIGSNDIAVDHGTMLQLAMDVHKFALSLNVAMVVLNAVLPHYIQIGWLAHLTYFLLMPRATINYCSAWLDKRVPHVWFSTRCRGSSARALAQDICQSHIGLMMTSTPIAKTA